MKGNELEYKSCGIRQFSTYILEKQEVVDAELQLVSLSHPTGFLGGIDTVVLNLGSNVDPLVPELFEPLDRDHPFDLVWRGDSIRTIAFEPVPSVVQRIEGKPWLHMVSAAVAGYSGVKPIHVYNVNAQSSSLHPSNVEFSQTEDEMVSALSDDVTLTTCLFFLAVPSLWCVSPIR